MPLPDFLIIGAQKAGTSWLAGVLAGHPQVYMPKREVHYFDKAHNYALGPDWYTSQFQHAQAVGEKTPDYFWTGTDGAEGHMGHVHKNIASALPEAKLIVIMREPVSRAVSAANHHIRSGRVSPFISVDSLLVGKNQHIGQAHGLIDKGMYYKHLMAYYEHFAPEQVLVLIYERDVKLEPLPALFRILRFLGLHDWIPDADALSARVNGPRPSWLGIAARHYTGNRRLARRLNRITPWWNEYRLPSRDTVVKLQDIYRPENEKLFEATGTRF